MRPVSDTLLQRITQPHRTTARLTVLDPVTFAVLGVLSGQDGVLLSGRVNMSRLQAIQRTCSFSIDNPSGQWSPGVLGDWLHINSLVRLERGVYLDAEQVEYVILGHFLLGRPRIDVGPAGSTIQADGEDRMKLMVRSRFTRPKKYAKGTRISSLIRAEAGTAGMGSQFYRLDDKGRTLTATRVLEEDEPRSTALRGLARDYGLELYVDAEGFLTLTEPPDPSTAPIAASFAGGQEATLLGLTKEWTDDRLYNHVLVTGESSDSSTPVVRGEAKDYNPSSPAYIYGPLGDRLYRYTSAMITDAAQAKGVALNLLSEVALLEEAISLGTVTNPALEPGDAILITEPLSKTEGRYLLDDVQIPLGLGEQALGSKIARKLEDETAAAAFGRVAWP